MDDDEDDAVKNVENFGEERGVDLLEVDGAGVDVDVSFFGV